MISFEERRICPDELNELDKMEQFEWDKSSEKIIKDDKIYINFSKTHNVGLL